MVCHLLVWLLLDITEAEDITSNLSNAAEGREFMNNFVRVNTIGLDEESVGIKTNFNQL